jgi:hypothetical protein
LHVEHGFTRHRHIDISRACKFLEQANCSTSLYFKLTEGIPKSTPFPVLHYFCAFPFSSSLTFSLSFFPPEWTKIWGTVCFLSYTFHQV